jgi:hypothetical protein
MLLMGKHGGAMKRVVFGFLLALFSVTAQAGATLHIGSGYGTTCATGGCPIYGTEVNNFNSTFDIYQNAASAPALTSPVDLILGVVNSSASADPAIMNSIQGATLIDTGGNKTPITVAFGNYAGRMTSSDVYSFLGLSGANKSNSFTNWSAAVLKVDGITASNFGIYVFQLNTSKFAANDYINLSSSLLPEGTFAVAYGVDSSGSQYSTAFTNAGMRDRPPLPEPMSLALVGLGLVGIALNARRAM